jgi:putative aldouronate transport system substrate-binding protein
MRIKRTLALIVMACLCLAMIAGCSQDNPSTTATTAKPTETTKGTTTSTVPEEVELSFYFWSDATPNDMDLVIEEFEKRTAETLNIKLNFIFTPLSDYNNKVNVRLAAGEAVDFAFDAPWQNMNTNILKGYYYKLDDYFNNPDYPGLYKAFSSNYIENNRFIDETGEYHTYGIPYTRAYGNTSAIVIRKDLREKYNLEPIESIEDLEVFFQKVLENENGMIPHTYIGSSVPSYVNSGFVQPKVKDKVMPWIQISNNGFWVRVVKQGDGSVMVYSSMDDYSSAPAPWNTEWTPTYVRELLKTWRQKGFVEKDVINQDSDFGMLKAGAAASIGGDSANIYSWGKRTEDRHPRRSTGIIHH